MDSMKRFGRASWLLGGALALSALVSACGGPEEDANGDAEIEAVSSPLAGTSSTVLACESAAQWTTTKGNVKLTQVRSEGVNALALHVPNGSTDVKSALVSSSASQLQGLITGADLAIDVMLPKDQPNPWWSGSLELQISSPSNGISDQSIGVQQLTGLRTGQFQTLRYTIPANVGTRLAGKTFTDFSVKVRFSLAKGAAGTYILDNLRIREGSGTRGSQITPGTSLTLKAIKNYDGTADVVASEKLAENVQVPQSFHVFEGSAGNGKARFVIARSGLATVSCEYLGNAASNTYEFSKCDSDALAGDLLPADTITLSVLSGDATKGHTKVRAQIALDPLGDDLGTGVAPIPTYWGSNAAEIAQILDAHVKAQFAQKGSGVVHLPSPELPLRPSVKLNDIETLPDPKLFDPPFNAGGALTGSDMADARWYVNGNIAVPNLDTGRLRAEFSLEAGTAVYLLGYRQDLLRIHGYANSDGGSVEDHQNATYDAEFCYSYLGITETCKGPYHGAATIALDPQIHEQVFKIHDEVTIFDVSYWVFRVAGSAGVDVSGDVNLLVTNHGLNVGFTPAARVFVRAEGGVSLGNFGGGGLTARVDLLTLSAPVTASVNLGFDLNPNVCRIKVSEGLSASVTLGAGSGSIGWYLEGGVSCGFWSGLCWRDEGDLFPWTGLSSIITLLPASPLLNQEIPLPDGTCDAKVDIKIASPVEGTTYVPGQSIPLRGSATETFASDADINVPMPVDCAKLTWTVDGSVVGNACSTPRATFSTTGAHDVTLSVSDGAVHASASRIVTVSDAGENPAVIIEGDNYLGSCFATGEVHANVTEPQGQPVTIQWFNQDTGALLDTGPSLQLGPTTHKPTHVHVVVTDPDGHTGMADWTVEYVCVK
jgi:hypothetical protein